MVPLHMIKEEPLNPKNPTLYLQNLNERIKIPDLKNAIYQLFSNYGEVVEVHAKRNIRMRGQAFVIYREQEEADTALQTLRGFIFFGKPLRVNYSKKQSDVTAKMRGTFEEGEKAKREQRRVQELSK
jgi:U2 small nuclear ribonucleoprotein B''